MSPVHVHVFFGEVLAVVFVLGGVHPHDLQEIGQDEAEPRNMRVEPDVRVESFVLVPGLVVVDADIRVFFVANLDGRVIIKRQR